MIDCRRLKKRRRSWLIRNLISTRFDLLRFQIRFETTTDQFFPIMFGQTYKTIRWITIIDQNKKPQSLKVLPLLLKRKFAFFYLQTTQIISIRYLYLWHLRTEQLWIVNLKLFCDRIDLLNFKSDCFYIIFFSITKGISHCIVCYLS